MPKLGFIDANDPEAFGFLDPSSVIRGCHIEPAFISGTTDQFLIGPSIARQDRDGDMDYFCYYVNMYVIVLSLVSYSNIFTHIGGQTEICSCAFMVGELDILAQP